MNLNSKLVLATTLGIAVVVFAFSFSRIRRESAAFRNDMRRDHRALISALDLAVSRVASRGELRDAIDILEQANAERENVNIRWIPISKQEVARPGGRPLAREVVEEVQTDESGPRFLVTRIAYMPAGKVLGYIELKESLDYERAYIKVTIIRAFVMSVIMMGLCAVIIYGCVRYFVSGPMKTLAARLQRIGDGHLDERLELGHRDEIGAFAQEINAMSEQLALSKERVEKETGARIAALEQLRHADRLSTVGKLASGVAHELGTPLNVVLARAKMIAAGQTSGAEAAEDARIIVEQTRRMADIIRQLLDFARRRTPKRSRRNLHAMAQRTISLLGPLAAKNGVDLQLFAGAGLDANIDESQLEQVLTNLVVNAVQAQPGGGAVRVRIEKADEQAPAVVGLAGGPGVSIAVEDDGEGMPAEVRECVFEPFFTTKDVSEGTGLGLSVAYGIVREHGGWIEVQSEPGRGSRFIVFLPE